MYEKTAVKCPSLHVFTTDINHSLSTFLKRCHELISGSKAWRRYAPRIHF